MPKSGRVKKGIACAFDGYLNPCAPPYTRVSGTKYRVCPRHGKILASIARDAQLTRVPGRKPATRHTIRPAA